MQARFLMDALLSGSALLVAAAVEPNYYSVRGYAVTEELLDGRMSRSSSSKCVANEWRSVWWPAGRMIPGVVGYAAPLFVGSNIAERIGSNKVNRRGGRKTDA
jgi:hypothetical protein